MGCFCQILLLALIGVKNRDPFIVASPAHRALQQGKSFWLLDTGGKPECLRFLFSYVPLNMNGLLLLIKWLLHKLLHTQTAPFNPNPLHCAGCLLQVLTSAAYYRTSLDTGHTHTLALRAAFRSSVQQLPKHCEISARK